jgi:hypothetical protein
MERLYINQKEDADCELTITQKDGSVLNLSGVSTRVNAVVVDGYGSVVDKFNNYSATSGYKLMDSSFLNIGKLKFSVLSTITKDLNPGDYYVEVLIRLASAAHTDDNYYDVPVKFYLFSVQKSVYKDLTLA